MEITLEKALELSEHNEVVWDKLGTRYIVVSVDVSYTNGKMNEIKFLDRKGKLIYASEIVSIGENPDEHFMSFDKNISRLRQYIGTNIRPKELLEIYRIAFEEGKKAKLIANAQEQLQK